MDEHPPPGRTLLTAAFVIVGAALIGWGIGNAIDNIVNHAHGQSWTVSAGGVVAGIGAALVLDAVLIRRAVAPWWAYVAASAGAVSAGYSLGGAIDNLLLEIDRQGHHFAPAMAVCGLGVGVAAAVLILAVRATPHRDG